MSDIDFSKFKEFDNHKSVTKFEDKSAGLVCFVAIHNDILGLPAVGGTRMLAYGSQDEAIADVLKLSRAMTYKCALANVPHGGAKGVIIGDSKKDKTPALLKAYAEAINSLRGIFYTGEDVGISQNDVNIMLKTSNYFIGRPDLAQDPSPYAALSTFYSIKSAVFLLFSVKSLNGVKVAIKGVGKVGGRLAELLSEENAIVYVSDIDEAALLEVKRRVPRVKIVEKEKIYKLPADVYAPCALGNEFSTDNVMQIRAKIICGAANNQLASSEAGDLIFKRGIVYVPDYIANSGGLIDVVDELDKKGYSRDRVLNNIEKVGDMVKSVIKTSQEKNLPTSIIADSIAESYFS